MKANEAPEKIWMDLEWISHFDCKDCITENSVEYTRTDAFIEKAENWLYIQLNEINMEGEDMENFLEDFKKYMEE